MLLHGWSRGNGRPAIVPGARDECRRGFHRQDHNDGGGDIHRRIPRRDPEHQQRNLPRQSNEIIENVSTTNICARIMSTNAPLSAPWLPGSLSAF